MTKLATAFVLMFAVTVQAQTSYLDSLNKSIGEMISYNQALNIQKVERFTVAYALLSLYDEYEADCYNDSTLTEGAVFRSYDTWKEFWAAYTPRGGEFIANLVRRESRWIHREATFKGFIGWIREEFAVREGQTKGQR